MCALTRALLAHLAELIVQLAKSCLYVCVNQGGSKVSILSVFRFFTALHVMQTRYCDEISVRLSVRLSVCLSDA